MIEKTIKIETVTTYRVNSAQVLGALVLAGVIPAPEEGAEVAVEAITPYGSDRSGDAFDIDEDSYNWSGGLRITVTMTTESTETGEPEVPNAPELGEPQQDDDDDGFGELGVEYRSALEARSAAPLPFVSIPEPKVRTRTKQPRRPKT